MTKTDRPRAGLAWAEPAAPESAATRPSSEKITPKRASKRFAWAGALLGVTLLATPAGAQTAPVAPPGVPPSPGAPMPPVPGGAMPPSPGRAMPPMSSHGMQMPPPGRGADPAYAQGYRDAMERMHRDMAIPPSANPDRDFAVGMIPHHQGAIDMARLELRYGHDPKLRKMAQEIIRAQEREIAELKRWLAAHPH